MADLDESRINSLMNAMTDGTSGFPKIGEKNTIIASRNLTKGAFGWKTILLVKTSGKYGERIELRLYSWGFSKKKEKWYFRGRFNMPPARYVYDIIEVLELLVEGSGFSPRKVKTLASKVDELERTVDTLQKKKSKIPEMRKRVKEFEDLLSTPDALEREVHSFLKREAWMFGPQYLRVVKSEKEMTITSRDDFLLKRGDGYYDVVELKSPRAILFVNRGAKKAMSKELKDAISQVIGYLTEKRKYYLSIRDQTGIDAFFPRGIIVIGRTILDDKELLKAHKEFLHSLDIWTYDDLLSSANRTIEIVKDIKIRHR